MAHFAKIRLDDNIVTEVNVVNNSDIGNLEFPESEPVGVQFLIPWNTPGTYWKQTSYNKNFRKNYAGIDYKYDPVLDAFIPPKLFDSWVLNEETCQWEPPIPCPEDGQEYRWDEETKSWVLLDV